MTPGQRRRLVTLLHKYAQAIVNDSWKGGGDPADIPEIEAELINAKRNLDHYLDILEKRTELAKAGPPAGMGVSHD